MTRDALERFTADLGALYRARRLYPAGNVQVARAGARAIESLRRWGRPVRITTLGAEAIVEDRSIEVPASPLAPLLLALAAAGFDNVALQPDVSVEGLTTWVGAVLAGRVAETSDIPGISTRVLQFDAGPPVDPGAEVAVAEHLEWVPAVEEALSAVAKERRQGLRRAREIVAAIAGHLAVGEDLLQPVRSLKGHDDYTFTHALNVCVLSTALARALAAPAHVVDEVALAGLCHDVGKQMIPVEVLNRPCALTPDERQIMDGHPAHGARLLVVTGDAHHPLLPVVAYQHHVGADGSGYPRVPGAGAPHPASLVVAVADVFDAMRTVRPYRAARTAEEACTALVSDAAKGRLSRRHVSAFLGTFRILRAGRAVMLDDERRAVVLCEGPSDPLEPTVEAEDGQVLDLSRPNAPRIAEIRERPA